MRHDPERFAMAVFSSYGTSLSTWDSAGMLSRETEYLRLLQDWMGPTALVTYGSGMGEDILAEETDLEAVKGKPGWAPTSLYSVFASLIHRRSLRSTDVLRTNQLRGAWTAAIASLVHRKPLAVRSGYVWSKFNENAGGSGLRLRMVNMLEKFALSRADVVIVASEADRDSLVDRHGLSEEKIHVVPNPIDTRTFRPDPYAKPQPGLVTFVGRLEPQKGIETLIDSLKRAPRAKLRIIGNGSQRLALAKRAEGFNVEFMGIVPNEKLPTLLRESESFVLPSLYEGTPKALLEAMACGVPVVAARSEGNEGVITHGVNGLLVDRSAYGLASGINSLMRDAELRTKLIVGGWRYVSERHSMEAAAKHEAGLIRRAAEARGVTMMSPEEVSHEVEEQSPRAA